MNEWNEGWRSSYSIVFLSFFINFVVEKGDMIILRIKNDIFFYYIYIKKR